MWPKSAWFCMCAYLNILGLKFLQSTWGAWPQLDPWILWRHKTKNTYTKKSRLQTLIYKQMSPPHSRATFWNVKNRPIKPKPQTWRDIGLCHTSITAFAFHELHSFDKITLWSELYSGIRARALIQGKQFTSINFQAAFERWKSCRCLTMIPRVSL